MLRLFGKGLTPTEAADLALFLALSQDPEARDASDLIGKAMIDPFAAVTLPGAQRDAVRAAIEAAPPNRLDWAKQRLL